METFLAEWLPLQVRDLLILAGAIVLVLAGSGKWTLMLLALFFLSSRLLKMMRQWATLTAKGERVASLLVLKDWIPVSAFIKK